jgi:glucose-6-phosphate dehydrogenase assembly protein OpcA
MDASNGAAAMGPKAGPVTGALARGGVAGPIGAAPELRWRTHVHDLAGIERELSRIWAAVPLATPANGVEERRVAARTSVMNLVVVAGSPEVGERCADTIGRLAGRHPSRTLIVLPSDPDGPAWVDAEVQAHCVLPRDSTAEACSERIFLKAGGDVGRHLEALVTPLLIHDLPVTIWWPGDVPFRSVRARALLEFADRLVVDATSWSGDGLARLRAMASLDRSDLTLSDFALIRQSRWREAIASTFDLPHIRPFLGSLQRIGVVYAGAPDDPDRPVNLVRPLYHVAWLASRLGMGVVKPLTPTDAGGLAGTLRAGRRRVEVRLQPEASGLPRGRTLRVDLDATRRGVKLRVAATADAEMVMVDAWRNGERFRHRPYVAPRRTDVDMLAEVIESVGLNAWTDRAIQMAAALVAPAEDDPAAGPQATSPEHQATTPERHATAAAQ